MFRRFLVALCRRTFALFLLICLGCSAQSASPDVTKRIERQVRSFYSLPSEVQITVGPLKPSEFPNYDTLTVTLNNAERKQDVTFLLSKDGKSLVRFTKMDLTKDPYAEVMKKIDTTGRPTRGNKDAKVVVVNYDDFQCPFCSRMHQELFPTIFKEYGDRVLFIYKDYPLVEIHPWATHAAVDANCLAAQNNDAYWDFADYIHSNQGQVNAEKVPAARYAILDKLALERGQMHALDTEKLQACMKAQKDDAVKASMKEADALGVTATPTLYINGEKVDGALPLPELRAVFNRALKDAGVPLPAAAASAPVTAPTPALSPAPPAAK
jgi:protein-disulfide isomerase